MAITTLTQHTDEQRGFKLWYPPGVVAPKRYELWLDFIPTVVEAKEGATPQETWAEVLECVCSLHLQGLAMIKQQPFLPHDHYRYILIYADCERSLREVNTLQRMWFFNMAMFHSHPMLEKEAEMKQEASMLLQELIGKKAPGATGGALTKGESGVPWAAMFPPPFAPPPQFAKWLN